MRSGIVILAAAALAGRAGAADSHWSRMRAPDFEMYTTAGERGARETLRYFEQIHGFFAQAMPASAEKSLPVRIVAFSSAKEYEPYRINEFATAYYRGTSDCDYIVMSHTGSETFPTAVHEYVHLVVRHANLNFPPWLNEGVAELYSTLRPMGDKILVGSLIAGRHQALLTEKWVPLAIILEAGQDSPYYNEKNKAGSLYNEGWALTHMLALDNAYRGRFEQAMRAISGGTASRAALEQTYGKPLAAIEKDLQSYLRGGRFQGVLIPARLEKSGADLAAEPAADFDVKLLLTRLKDSPANRAATEKALRELIASDASRPEPHADLGYLLWRDRDNASALDEFARAFELGSRGPRLLWDYGRLAELDDPASAVRALSELLGQQPERLEVRMELASAQLRAHRAQDAVETLKPAKKATPADAPRLLMLIGMANLEAGDRVMARNAAEQLKKLAEATPGERDTAERILRAAETARQAAEMRREAPPRPASPDERPRLQHRERPEMTLEVHTERAQRPSFRGTFVELRCETPAKILLQTAEGKKLIAIDDPKRLMVNGTNGATMDLTCGRQKPAPVRIEYDPAGADHPGIDGLARGIQFEK